jgi:ATP-dependent Clp protease, protease subunit
MQNARPTVSERETTKYDGLPAEDIINLRLLDNSTYLLSGDIDPVNIDMALRWLIHENLKEGDRLLTLYINSTGGNLDDAFALIDIMQTSQHQIRTIGIGNLMSSAFLIFAAGTKGLRYVGHNTNILSHQYSDGIDGKHHDIKAFAKTAENTNKRMADFLSKVSGKSLSVIKKKLLPPSDVWLTPQELIDLNIADEIL